MSIAKSAYVIIVGNICTIMIFRPSSKNHYILRPLIVDLPRSDHTKNVIVYSTKVCPNCKILKQILNESDISFDEVDMTTPAALTELVMNNVFTMSAPVLKIHNMFYTTDDMMDSDTLNRQKVEDIISNI